MSSEAAVFSTRAIGGTYPPFFTVSALPGKLERRFEKEEHAYQFMAGSVRFGLLQQYRKMEGGRRDETEGRASIRWRAASPELLHNAEYTGLSFEPYSVLCASHPEACECAVAKFGRFVVSINDPVELLRRIVDAWEHHGRYSSPAFITPVLYNKGDLVEPPPYYIAQPLPCVCAKASRPLLG